LRTGRQLASEVQKVLIAGSVALPATGDDFTSTERRLGISLPSDMRDFYGVMNGTNELTDLDHGLIRFWPLDEWKLAGEEAGAALDVQLQHTVVVADHLHWSWAFAADFTKAPTALPFFIVGGSGGLVPIAATFSAFVELVLLDDPKIYEG